MTTAKAAAPKMTAREVLARLRRHYIKPGEPLPGGVFLPEVTYGRAGGRRCDAVYVGFTATSGRQLVGHEIKVSRSDWLHELDDPYKADTWVSQCHAWYVVAPDSQLVRPEELPHGWGLLTCEGPSKTRLKVVVKSHLPPRGEQIAWVTALSLLAKQDTERAGMLIEARTQARDDAAASAAQQVELEVARRLRFQPDVDTLKAELAKYRDALGITLAEQRWRTQRGDEVMWQDVRTIGDAIKAEANVQRALEQVAGRYGGHGLAALIRQLTEVKAAIEALAPLVTEAGSADA